MAGVGRAKRSLGQHFLADPGVIRRIVEAAPPAPARIVEIGPGRGALLEPLLAAGRPVLAIEKDTALAAHWRHAGHDTLSLLEADAAEDDWIGELPAGEWGIVANLPYNVSTVILRRLLAAHERFPWMVLMFQREVAERIEQPGGREGGPLGLLAALAFRVRRVVDAPPGAFRPPPRVHSRVLRFDRLDDAVPGAALAAAWPTVLRLYQRRRARLDRIVAGVAGVDRDTVGHWFHELGLREDARIEHIDAAGGRSLLQKLGAL